jgi:hypothetical protein
LLSSLAASWRVRLVTGGPRTSSCDLWACRQFPIGRFRMLALRISNCTTPNPTPGAEQFAEEVRSETAGAEARSHPDDLRGPYGILSRMGRALVFVAGKVLLDGSVKAVDGLSQCLILRNQRRGSRVGPRRNSMLTIEGREKSSQPALGFTSTPTCSGHNHHASASSARCTAFCWVC